MKKRNWMIGILCLLLGCCIGCASAESVDAAAIEALLDEWEKAYPTEVLLAEMEAENPHGPAGIPTDSDIPPREALRGSIELLLRLRWETLDMIRTFKPILAFHITPEVREWVVTLDYMSEMGPDSYVIYLDAESGTWTKIRNGSHG